MGKTAEDLTGQKFGRLTVECRTEDYISKSGAKYVQWNCKCVCGESRKALSGNLKKGLTQSCGCLLKESSREKAENMVVDLTNKRFGRLLVLERSKERRNKFNGTMWRCLCDCGKEKNIAAQHLTSQASPIRSCGCLGTEKNKKMIKNAFNNLSYIDGTEIFHIENKTTLQSNNTSGIRGVSFDKSIGKYAAYIHFKQKKYYLGIYDKLEDAAKARSTAEDKIYGEFLEWYYEEHPEKKKLNCV